jgi:hypothetical protein
MDGRFRIFIVVGTLAVMAFYCLSTNTASAETNCYTIGEHYVCIFTSNAVQPPAKALVFCDKDGKNCTVTWASKVNPVTPEAKNAINSAQTALLAKNNVNPPECPNTGPIPPNCTMKPPLK